MEAFYSLLGQGSFYGGNKETVCSLLLSILPRPTHKCKPITQSVVVADTEVDDAECSLFTVITKASSNKVLLLQNVVKCLQEFGGFCYMEVSSNCPLYCNVIPAWCSPLYCNVIPAWCSPLYCNVIPAWCSPLYCNVIPAWYSPLYCNVIPA